MNRIMLVVALSSLAACEPPLDTVELVTVSSAPFASKATIESDHERDAFVIEVSVGVAVAVACWDTCYPDKLCKLTSEEPDKLGVRPLYRLGSSTAEDYVLVAQNVGLTTLRVDSACASQEYVVRVVARGP